MKLGQLAFRKSAQSGQPPIGGAGLMWDPMGMLQRAQHQRLQHGQRASDFAYGPPEAPGFVTGQQAVVGGAQGLLGPLGAMATGFLMPYIQAAAGKAGVDLQEPYQIAYGANPEDAREIARVTGQVMQRQFETTGATVQDVVSAADRQIQEHFGVDLPLEKIRQFPAGAVGNFVQQLSMFFPEIQTILSASDPRFISDLSPMVKATYAANNGEFDPNVFRNIIQDFQQTYNKGNFRGVPAQIAMHAVQYAKERGGPGAGMREAVNAAQSANAFVQSGLAPSFGEALTLINEVDPSGGLKNPTRAIRYASQLNEMAKRGFVDRKHIYEAARVAKQQGLPIRAAMTAVAGGGRARTMVRGPRGSEIAETAASTMARMGESDTMKLLAAAHQQSPKARGLIERALETGDNRLLDRVIQQAQQSPRLMASKNQVDASYLINRMDPNMLRGQVMSDVRRFAAQTGSRDLQRIIARPEELQRRLRTRDFTGLDPQAVRYLSEGGPTGGRLGAAAMTFAEPFSVTTDFDRYYKPPKRLGRPFPEMAPSGPPVTQRFEPTKR